jgi:hypothetical protein
MSEPMTNGLDLEGIERDVRVLNLATHDPSRWPEGDAKHIATVCQHGFAMLSALRAKPEPMTKDLDLEGIGAAALAGLLDRAGIGDALSAIKRGDPETWADIVLEAGEGVAALRAKPEAVGVGAMRARDWPTGYTMDTLQDGGTRIVSTAAPPAPVSPWRTMMLAELEKCRIVAPDGHHGGWRISGKNSINALFTDLGGKHDAPPVSHKDQGGGRGHGGSAEHEATQVARIIGGGDDD